MRRITIPDMAMTRAGRLPDVPSAAHTYVRVGALYLHTEQSWLSLSRALTADDNPFLKPLSRAGWRRFLPASWQRRAHAVRLLLLWAARRGGRYSDRLELPVSGTLAVIRESSAIKVLDFGKQQVHTILPAAALPPQAWRAQRVSDAPFSSTLERVHHAAGYYTETLLRGRHPNDQEKGVFEEVYLPLLRAVAAAEPPQSVSLGGYAAALYADIQAPHSLLWRLPAQPRAALLAFLGKAARRLDTDEPVPLVLSHGDLFADNVVLTSDGPRLLDWVRSKHRSPLFDAYFLLVHSVCKRSSPAETAARLEAAALSLHAASGEALRPALSREARWRWLFYLEASHMKLVACDREPENCAASQMRHFRRYAALEAHYHARGAPSLLAAGAQTFQAVMPPAESRHPSIGL
jgi:hypothetical protein